jgi:hypothetical protein
MAKAAGASIVDFLIKNTFGDEQVAFQLINGK